MKDAFNFTMERVEIRPPLSTWIIDGVAWYAFPQWGWFRAA